MKLASLQHDHDECLRKGADLLGTPVRAVSLDWPVEQLLRAHLHLESRLGLNLELPFLSFNSGPKGQDLEFGLEKYRLEIEGKSIGLVKILAPCPNRNAWKWYQFWAVPVEHHRRLYRFLRRLERSSMDVVAPMSFAETDEIKKLLVLRFLETKTWDWGAAWAAYQSGHNTGKSAQRIGFNSPGPRNRNGIDSRVAVTF